MKYIEDYQYQWEQLHLEALLDMEQYQKKYLMRMKNHQIQFE